MPSGIYLACEDEIFFSHHVVPHSNTLHNPLSLSHNQFVSKNIVSSTNHYGSRSPRQSFELSTLPLKPICFWISTMRTSIKYYGSKAQENFFQLATLPLKIYLSPLKSFFISFTFNISWFSFEFSFRVIFRSPKWFRSYPPLFQWGLDLVVRRRPPWSSRTNSRIIVGWK